MNNTLKTIDLFCGAGGLSVGLSKAGFKIVFANDLDKDAAETFKINHPGVPFSQDNIANLRIKEILNLTHLKIGDLDLLAGGPPCQGFSTVGSKNKQDPRNRLFEQYVRIVEGLMPRFIFFENVSGFMKMYGGLAYKSVLDEFEKLGYKNKAMLINAVQFGLPQHRERTIIIACREQYDFNFPMPTHSLNANDLLLKKALTIEDALSDLPLVKASELSSEYASRPKNEYQMKMRTSRSILTEHKAPKHGKSLLRVIRNIPPGGCIQDIDEKYRPKTGFRNTYARLWWDKSCTTITRNFGTPSSSRCVHPFLDRGLTTREGARLQGFDDDYKFCGSTSSKNLQIGNAVPPILAEHIGNEIIKSLKCQRS